MAIPGNLTREHVLAGIRDFEAGVPHQFGKSTKYDLVYAEKRYPPKVVVGFAAKHATGVELTPGDFRGGESTQCFKALRKLGFTVDPKPKVHLGGPPQRDAVAFVFQANPKRFKLDEYLSRHTYIYWSCPKFSSQVSVGMPMFLKRSGKNGGIVAKGTIAELPAAMELVKRPAFLREDLWTEKTSSSNTRPRVGIQLDEVRLSIDDGMMPTAVLESIPELNGHPLTTFRQATVFRLSAEQAVGLLREWGGPITVPPSSTSGTEGERVLVTHLRIERDRKLIADKKSAFRQEHGRLFCEVCRRDFDSVYGALWNECAIEAHHLKPLGELQSACRTELKDLLLVCSICHRLIHATKEVDSNLRELRDHFFKAPTLSGRATALE